VLPLPEALLPASQRMRSRTEPMQPLLEALLPTLQRMRPGPRQVEFSPLPEAGPPGTRTSTGVPERP
jgi:hypothetical protein